MATKFRFNLIKTTKTLAVIISVIILVLFGRGVFVRHFFNERLTTIPDVVNLTEKDAVKYLKEAGLNPKIIRSKTEKVPLDTVFIQDPAPGRQVKVNRNIRIWVNNGQDLKVPNIVGKELLEARAQLRGQNIQIENIDYYPSNQKYNTILGVYPKPGTNLEMNQKISILVSSQQAINPSVMPNLIGLTLNDARELLKQIGLEIGNVSRTQDATLPVNTIISSDPNSGVRIQKGQKVNVVINTGVPQRKQKESVEDIVTRNDKRRQEDDKEIERIINNTTNEINQVRENNGNSGGNNNNNQGSQNSGGGQTTPSNSENSSGE